MAFAADGQGIISGAKDGTIRLWPTNAATREKFYEGDWMPIKFSQDGRMLAAIADQSKFVLLAALFCECWTKIRTLQSQRPSSLRALRGYLRLGTQTKVGI